MSLNKLESAQELELKWLRYFYYTARECMGPADSEGYQYIKEAYIEGGGVLPPGDRYALEVEEEDE